MEFCLEVSGEYACFTRPEMRAERVSYDVITPSASRNIFQAIFWKPAIKWQVERIEILKPIRWMNIRRNEVGAVIHASKVRSAMKKGKGKLGLFIEHERQQRSSLILKDVSYRIYARCRLTESAESGEKPEKYRSMFLRRVRKGQCFRQPYLGCKEFPADFRLVESEEGQTDAIQESRELGWMFYDYDYDANPPAPRFFKAQVVNGVMQVPPVGSGSVLG